jgi:hypothetical protein
MSFGAASSAMIFIFISMGATIISVYLITYAAHCFLTVLVGTAAGSDSIQWPDEPFLDWWWKAFYLLWLLSLWLLVVAFLVLFVLPNFFPNMSDELSLALIAGLIWLFYPVSLMSALASDNRWLWVLHGELLRRLGHHLPSYVVVSAVSAVLTFGWMALALYSIYIGPLWFLLASAPLGAAVWLINARLVGRLGWLISHRTEALPETAPAKKKKKKRTLEPALESHDPWNTSESPPPPDAIQDMNRPEPEPQPEPNPEEMEDEWGPPKPYRVSAKQPVAAPSPPTKHSPRPEDEEEEEEPEDEWGPPKPYRVSTKPPVAAPSPPTKPSPRPIDALDDDDVYDLLPVEKSGEPLPIPLDGYIPIGTELPPKPPSGEGPMNNSGMESIERRLAKGREDLKPPRYPLWSGVFTFPWYQDSLRPWAYLTFLGLVLGFLLHWQMLMWPFGRE